MLNLRCRPFGARPPQAAFNPEGAYSCRLPLFAAKATWLTGKKSGY